MFLNSIEPELCISISNWSNTETKNFPNRVGETVYIHTLHACYKHEPGWSDERIIDRGKCNGSNHNILLGKMNGILNVTRHFQDRLRYAWRKSAYWGGTDRACGIFFYRDTCICVLLILQLTYRWRAEYFFAIHHQILYFILIQFLEMIDEFILQPLINSSFAYFYIFILCNLNISNSWYNIKPLQLRIAMFCVLTSLYSGVKGLNCVKICPYVITYWNFPIS